MGHLRVRNLGKAYKRYRRKWGRLAEWIGVGVHHELTWVLRDLTFDIAPGEAVGIIGANGAGKSTLLKLATGTVRPTSGTCEAGGRVAGLLELGIGFHPDFTGRQNVYMAGQTMGIPGARLRSSMAEIEAFAEIGDYIDQPVRTYSSGMQVRLAFSVATAVRPDILVVDEALSVGDAYFQHKSFDRIRKFRDAGTTLLFVSHSAAAIKTLCDRAILLEHGILLRDGAPDAVLDYYNALIAAQRADYEIRQSEAVGGRTTRSGTAEASIESIELVRENHVVRAVRSGDAVVVRIAVRINTPLQELSAGVLMRDRLGNDVFGTNTFYLGATRNNLAAGDRATIDFTFPRLALGAGSYSISAALHAGDRHTLANYDWWDRALVFQVFPPDGPTTIGVCALEVRVAWHELAGGEPKEVTADVALGRLTTDARSSKTD
jgi:lipopolysaccharide transport system ATP-binding protein